MSESSLLVEVTEVTMRIAPELSQNGKDLANAEHEVTPLKPTKKPTPDAGMTLARIDALVATPVEGGFERPQAATASAQWALATMGWRGGAVAAAAAAAIAAATADGDGSGLASAEVPPVATGAADGEVARKLDLASAEIPPVATGAAAASAPAPVSVQEKEAAAVTIAKHARGHITRQKSRKETKAAITIQTAARGCNARKLYQKKRQSLQDTLDIVADATLKTTSCFIRCVFCC